MLVWANIFLALSVVAGLFGLSGPTGSALDLAKVLFVVFALLFMVSLVAHLITKREPPTQ
ncbi:DUF1328 domain-containing protein [Microbulbifer sp. THAF38]|uniref:DUF1328 domain-containing protein n=1 Tax=unclassified Microbulbifer TaxID=2619833 RepID=UPI001268ABE6|nr:DUF1328 domain-containing protein [Microbulbifer sp. THAF38]QFT55987.1 hypothetical protein FIU95_15665 [Microbulbifer sp. THAF38]